MTEPLLQLQGVSLAYGEGTGRRTVLADLALQIAAGSSLALVGPSGSGKTSLLNLLTGLQVPDAGQVQLCLPDAAPVDLAQLDADRRALLRRRAMGHVFQFFNLLPTLTVAENVLLAVELAGHGGDRQWQADALGRLQAMGLGDRLDAFPDALSGGEQQRVAIARALAHRPLLVVADEPTGNLDRRTAEQVADLLFDTCAAAGASLVVATHSEQLAARADRVLAMPEA